MNTAKVILLLEQALAELRATQEAPTQADNMCRSCGEEVAYFVSQCTACEEDRLGDYSGKPLYQQFVRNMRLAGLDPEHYRGRNFFNGPAVVTEDPDQVIRATLVPLTRDNMGNDYILYPKV